MYIIVYTSTLFIFQCLLKFLKLDNIIRKHIFIYSYIDSNGEKVFT